jgi:hypothetical protein
MLAKFDLTGRRFGRLVACAEAGRSLGSILWLCHCDCGNETLVTGCHLRHGTISCGCAKRERMVALAPVRLEANTHHGHAGRLTRTAAYRCWDGMLQRCTNPHHRAWKNYGGRGINVCKRWLKFENFLADMGEPPEGLTLDRVNNNSDYKPSNCRWATRLEQRANVQRRAPLDVSKRLRNRGQFV